MMNNDFIGTYFKDYFTPLCVLERNTGHLSQERERERLQSATPAVMNFLTDLPRVVIGLLRLLQRPKEAAAAGHNDY